MGLVLVLGRGECSEVSVVDVTPVGHFDDSWPFVLMGEFYRRSCVSCCQQRLADVVLVDEL